MESTWHLGAPGEARGEPKLPRSELVILLIIGKKNLRYFRKEGGGGTQSDGEERGTESPLRGERGRGKGEKGSFKSYLLSTTKKKRLETASAPRRKTTTREKRNFRGKNRERGEILGGPITKRKMTNGTPIDGGHLIMLAFQASESVLTRKEWKGEGKEPGKMFHVLFNTTRKKARDSDEKDALLHCGGAFPGEPEGT